MNCFFHRDRAAVGLCVSCQRGLCPECAVDMKGLLACRGRCEVDVGRIGTWRAWGLQQPRRNLSSSHNQRVVLSVLGWAITVTTGTVLLLLVAAPPWRPFGAYVIFLFVGIMLLFAASRVRARAAGLCPYCEYDMRGSRGEVCPECGNCVRRESRSESTPKHE